MSDVPPPAGPATILDRLLAAGVSRDRALKLLGDGAVRVAGDVVTDPDAPAPWPTPWVFGPT